mgnify:CR=1 FL=1
MDVVTSVPMDVCTIAAGSVPIDATGTIGVLISMPCSTDEAATPSDSLWKKMAAGNKGVAYLSESADMDNCRRGVAISRFTDVMEAMREKLTDPRLCNQGGLDEDGADRNSMATSSQALLGKK